MSDQFRYLPSSSSRHPLPPNVTRYSRDINNSASSRSSLQSSSSIPQLPTYDDIIPTSSDNTRRRSENDMQRAIGKRKSFRNSSMRRKQQRARPEITIVSSQPMNRHPAFADGNKGSCVPPEAPPSYEEVLKESVPDQNQANSQSYIDQPEVLARVSTNLLPTRVAAVARNFESFLEANDNPNLPSPLTPCVLLPTSRGSNRNQNNRDSPSLADTSSNADLIETTSTNLSKPPVPKKPTFLTKPSSTTSSTSAQAQEDNNNSDMSSVTANPVNISVRTITSRKLPPPPRPTTGPKKPPRLAAIPKDKSAENTNNKPKINNDNFHSHSAFVAVENFSPADVQPMAGNSSTIPTILVTETQNSSEPGADEPTYAVFKKTSKPKSKNVQPEADQTTVIDEEPLDNLKEDLSPPPIPDSRPPLEDYVGIFDSQKPESSKFSSNAAKDIADVFGDGLSDKALQDEDPYSKINLTTSNNRVTENIPSTSSYPERISPVSSDDDFSASIEPPYETASFRKEQKGPINVKKLPKNTASSHSKSSTSPPPLPPFPAASKDESNLLNRPNAAPKPSNVTQPKKEGTPKRINSAKRKSLKLKQKFLKPKNSYDELDNSQHTRDTNPSGSETTTSGHAIVDRNNLKAAKRAPPPRPALPLVLQNKLHHTTCAKTKPSNNVIYRNNTNKTPSENSTHSLATSPVRRKKPPKHPPPLPNSRPFSVHVENPAHLKAGLPSGPVPKPRSTPIDPINNGNKSKARTIKFNNLPSPTRKAPQKPSRPPTARKANPSEPATNLSKPVSQDENLSEDNKSFLEIASESKNESTKPQVDEIMKNYLCSEATCIVTQNYQPENFSDLPLEAGEKILVLKEVDDQLLFGRKENGQEGTIPRLFLTTAPNVNNSNVSLVKKPPVAKRRHTMKQPKKNSELLGKAVALHDYSTSNPDDLNFTAGTHIDVIDHIGSEWLKGRVGEKEGLFPRNFVSLTPSAKLEKEFRSTTKTLPLVTALHDFEAEFENELTFKAGDQLQIVNRVDHEWLKAKLNGRIGIIPLAFVDSSKLGSTLDDPSPTCEKTSANLSSNNNKFRSDQASTNSANTNRTATALYDFNGENDSELSLKKNDVIIITGQIDSEWLKGRLGEKKGMFPAKFVAVS